MRATIPKPAKTTRTREAAPAATSTALEVDSHTQAAAPVDAAAENQQRRAEIQADIATGPAVRGQQQKLLREIAELNALEKEDGSLDSINFKRRRFLRLEMGKVEREFERLSARESELRRLVPPRLMVREEALRMVIESLAPKLSGVLAETARFSSEIQDAKRLGRGDVSHWEAYHKRAEMTLSEYLKIAGELKARVARLDGMFTAASWRELVIEAGE